MDYSLLLGIETIKSSRKELKISKMNLDYMLSQNMVSSGERISRDLGVTFKKNIRFQQVYHLGIIDYL